MPPLVHFSLIGWSCPLSGHHGRVRAMAKAGWQTVFVQVSLRAAAGEIRLRRKPVTDQRCCVVPEGEVKVFGRSSNPAQTTCSRPNTALLARRCGPFLSKAEAWKFYAGMRARCV